MRKSGRRLLLLAAVVSAALAAGCYGPKFPDCTIACGPGAQCPGGLACIDGHCTASTSCADGGQLADADAHETGSTPDAADTGDASDARDVSDETDAGDAGDAGDADDAADAGDADAAGDAGDADDAADADDAGGAHDAGNDAHDAGDPGDADGTSSDARDAADAGNDPHDADSAGDVPEGGRPDGDVPDGNDGPTTPWTPAVIPNLVLWLEGDRGIEAAPGAKISEWRDQSLLHNDAKQSTAMFAPKLATDPLSGMPGVQFAPKAWMMIKDDLSLRWGVLDFLVLVVYRATGRCEGACVLQQLYRKQEVNYPWSGPGLGLKPEGRIEVHIEHDRPDQWLVSSATGYDTGRIHLVGAQRRSSWPSMRIDGTEFPSALPTVVTNVDAPGENVYFGAHGINPDPPIDFPFSGYISAIIAVAGPISATDVAQLESYLMAKYGIVPGGPP